MKSRDEFRYPLNARANFSWDVADHRREQGEGVTRDLSTIGAFVVTPTCPPIQTPVRVEIVLPSLPGMKSLIRLSGEARVIRIEHPASGHGENGFAILKDDLEQWTLTSCQNEFHYAAGPELSVAGRSGMD